MKPPDDAIDSLVRSYLDRQASRVDPAPGIARIDQTLGRSSVARSRPSFTRRLANRWTLGLATAALILMALGVFSLPARNVSAESIVRQAKVAHAAALDRCYRVETNIEVESLDAQPALSRPRKIRLWTRGDRFWIESQIGLQHINWGRDQSGGLWVAYNTHGGLRFDMAEVPPAIAIRCEVFSVQLETLLSEVLTDFDLKSDPETPTIIRATLRPGRRRILRSAVLEVDPTTQVLKRLELTRSIAGRNITSRFQLEETRDLDDSFFELEGHLDPPYQIDDQKVDLRRRRQILLRHFGFAARPGEGLPVGNLR